MEASGGGQGGDVPQPVCEPTHPLLLAVFQAPRRLDAVVDERSAQFPLREHVDDRRPSRPGWRMSDIDRAWARAVFWYRMFAANHAPEMHVLISIWVFDCQPSRQTLALYADAVGLLGYGFRSNPRVEDVIGKVNPVYRATSPLVRRMELCLVPGAGRFFPGRPCRSMMRFLP